MKNSEFLAHNVVLKSGGQCAQSGLEKVISGTGVSLLKVRPRGAQRFVLNGLTALRECEGNRSYDVRQLNLSPSRGAKKDEPAACHTLIYKSATTKAAEIRRIQRRSARRCGVYTVLTMR